MIWYFSHPEPRRPMTTSRTHSPGADGTRAAALIALARHDASVATLTPRELTVMHRVLPTPHVQLLAQGPWLGT